MSIGNPPIVFTEFLYKATPTKFTWIEQNTDQRKDFNMMADLAAGVTNLVGINVELVEIVQT